MKRELTNEQLWTLANDMRKVQSESPTLSFLLGDKINRFFQVNAMSIKILNSRLGEIQKKYIVHNEQGEPQLAPVEEGKPLTWQYLESAIGKDAQVLTGDAIEKAYEADFNEFMKRSVTVSI